MINVFAGVLHRGIITSSILPKAEILFNLRPVRKTSLKLFSLNNASFQQHNFDGRRRELPNLFYIQNPITWLINKIDFVMLKNAWDPEFDEKEFKRGVKQAVSIICTLLSKNLWSNLQGLVTNKTLTRLQRDVEVNWDPHQTVNIGIVPSDIKLMFPRKVHFLRVADQKFVDVDVICVAMKYLDFQPWDDAEIILIEVMARFHRNYTRGQIPNWTVTQFRLNTQNVKPNE